MKKLLIITSIFLVGAVYAARRSNIVNYIYMCKNRHKFLPEQVNKFRKNKYDRPICPKCGKTLYAYKVEH